MCFFALGNIILGVVMNIQFSSFSSIFKNQKINNVGINKFSHPNLAPLPKDTVSFSGRSELVATDMSDAPTPYDCFRTEINAEPAAHYLEKVLDHYLQPLITKPKGKKAERPLNATLSTRIKSATSIREKVVSKHAKLYRKEYKAFTISFLSELKKNFDLKKNLGDEDLYVFVKQSIKHDNADTKYSPYSNIHLYCQSKLFPFLIKVEVIHQQRMEYWNMENT